MITESDSASTIDLGRYYAILPSDGSLERQYQNAKVDYRGVEKGFTYNSGSNNEFLTVEQIRDLIKRNIDADFVAT